MYDSLFDPVIRSGASVSGWLKVLQRYDLVRRELRWVGLYWWVTRDELEQIVAEARAFDDPFEAAHFAVRCVYESWFDANAGSATHLLDKSPGNLHYGEHILGRFPEARMVEVLRDGRDVCVSLEKQALRARWPPVDRAEQIRLWRRAAEKGNELLDAPEFSGRIQRIRYEELHRDPIGTLERAHEFVGLDADRMTLERTLKANAITQFSGRSDGSHRRKGIVGDWHDELDAVDLDIIEREAGDLLRSLGYV